MQVNEFTDPELTNQMLRDYPPTYVPTVAFVNQDGQVEMLSGWDIDSVKDKLDWLAAN